MSDARAVGAPIDLRGAPLRSVESLFECTHHALIVGVDDYAPDIGALSGAAADARAVAAVLRDPARKDRFDPVTLLTDREATREGIKRAFRELRRLVEDDRSARVLLYFAGHGVSATAPEEAEGDTPGYFLPQDARRGDASSYLSMADVRRAIDGLKCHHLLLVLDCCFAGAFRWCATRASSPSPRKLYEERVRRYLRDPAWHVITSAAHDERALDTLHGKVLLAGDRAHDAVIEDVNGARSPFAVALVKALRGDADLSLRAATGPDGVITGSEIHLYIEGLFSEWEGGGARRFQRPLFFHWPTREGNKGEFVFLNPRAGLRLERAVELVEANNPYRGLEPYTHDARDSEGSSRARRFFGRDALTRDLVAKVKAEAIVAVLGASGTGKSSLVCAGALPALQAEGWAALPVVRPGEAPAKALRALALALDAEAPVGDGLARVVEGFFGRHPEARRVAVIDQLEELVTLQRERGVKGDFLRSVEEAVAASDGRLRVVYTLRSDFEPHFAAELVERRPAARFRVTSLSPAELREVIERPAEECVFCFDPPGLVDEIAREVVDAPGALPLLSFTLSEMYLGYARAFGQGLRDDRALTRDDYAALGGVEGSLGRHAERVYDALPDDATRRAMRRVVLRMVSLEGGIAARRRVLETELAYVDEGDTARARAALDALTAARLVVRGEHDGAAFAEPAHDKIVLGWPRLREWLDAPGEKERMEALGILREKRSDWVRLGRASGWLDRDTRLRRWIEALDGPDNPFNRDEAILLRESDRLRQRSHEDAEERAARMRDSLALAGALVLMSRKDFASANRLLLEVARPEALRGWNDAARQWLKTAMTHIALRAAGGDGAAVTFHAAAFSPDDLRVVTASSDRAARVWSVDGALLHTLPHEEDVRSVAFNADGDMILTVSGGRAWVWSLDAPTGPSARPLAEAVSAAVFSPDGWHVLTVSSDRVARIWSVEGGAALLSIAHEGELRSALFDAEGSHVVTASGRFARVWSATEEGDALAAIEHEAEVDSAAFSADGALLLTLSGGCARVWSADGQADPITFGDKAVRVDAAAFSADGRRVVCAVFDRAMFESAVQVWNADGIGEPVILHDPSFAVADAAFSVDGLWIVARSAEGPRVIVWNADGNGEPVVLNGHEGGVRSVSLSPNGARVVTTSLDGTTRVWSFGVDEPLVLEAFEGAIHSIAFSPDGRRVVTADTRGTAYVLNADGSGLPVHLQDEDVNIRVARFSDDGWHVITLSERKAMHRWRADGATRPVLLPPPDPTAKDDADPRRALIAFDAQLSAARARTEDFKRADERRYPWEMTPIEFVESATLRVPTVITAFRQREGRPPRSTVSADGVYVLSALTSERGGEAVWLWSTTGHREPVGLPSPRGATLHSGVFSPDGRRVVTLYSDKTVSVWDVERGGAPFTLGEHESLVADVVFSPDGQRLVTLTREWVARLWTASTPALRQRLQAATVDALSPDLRQAWLGEDEDEAQTKHTEGTALDGAEVSRRQWISSGDPGVHVR